MVRAFCPICGKEGHVQYVATQSESDITWAMKETNASYYGTKQGKTC
jgi:hypothetical protein